MSLWADIKADYSRWFRKIFPPKFKEGQTVIMPYSEASWLSGERKGDWRGTVYSLHIGAFKMFGESKKKEDYLLVQINGTIFACERKWLKVTK